MNAPHPKLRTRKCRICKGKYVPKNAMLPICEDFECKVAYATQIAEKSRQNRIKSEKKETRERKQKLKTLADHAADTQKIVNQSIKVRDYGKPCISCGKPYDDTFQAGHFRSVGAAKHLRFDERNIHGQCVKCNMHLSANLLEYRKGLVNRFGPEFVEVLENDNRVHKWTREELAEIRNIYRLKLKELKKDKENKCH